MNHDLRKITYEIISEFEKNKSQLKLTRDQIINKADFSSKDKSRITVFTNEVVKWRKKIDYYISINLKKSISKLDKRILNVLRIGYYEILFDAKIPIYASVDYWVQFTKIRFGRIKAGFCNAILRKARKVKINSNKNFKKFIDFFFISRMVSSKMGKSIWDGTNNKTFKVFQSSSKLLSSNTEKSKKSLLH